MQEMRSARILGDNIDQTVGDHNHLLRGRAAKQVGDARPRERRSLDRLLVQPLGERDFVARSEEHTSELQSLMRISYAVFCLKKKKIQIESVTPMYTYNQN